MNSMNSTVFFGVTNRIIIILLILFAHGYALAVDLRSATLQWQLSETKTATWGTLATSEEGRLRTGIRMEGKAAATLPDGSLADGVFSITMTAFTPSENMPGQRKGFWYLTGNWTINASDRDREQPYRMEGVLKASVPFDITVENGIMEGDVRLQQRGVSHRPGRLPMGSFSGTTKLEGVLTVPFIPQPSTGVKKPGRIGL